jgi:hypothetical protein
MENTDLLKFILPEDFVLHFDLIEIENSGEQLIFLLDEKFNKPPEHNDKNLESKGFSNPFKVLDFPIRDRAVILKVRCRKWKDKDTGKVYSRDWELKAKGTSYTKEFAAFLKKLIDTNPVSANSVGKTYQIDGSQLGKHYKNHLSGYHDWEQSEHSEDWVLYPDNLTDTLCLDEVALSNGELYTILTNAKAKTQEGSLIAMIKGVKSADVLRILEKIPLKERKKVTEVSVDMANNMEKIASNGFPGASVVTDRFHVAKLISDAVQEIRIRHRWEAISEENKKIKDAKDKNRKYVADTFENGDTKKQLLARSRYLLFKPENKRTQKQEKRAKILFEQYQDIEQAYKLSMKFRNIYQTAKSKEDARNRFIDWFEEIDKYGYDSFVTAAESVKSHFGTILNYFENRTTNALAETFNSKLKAFRAVFRGVTDLSFFIFRVTKIFG